MMHLPTNKRFTTIADVIAILRTEYIDYVLYIMRTKRKSQLDAIGRVTKNHRKDVVSALGTNGVKAILDSADVFHCQSFEQSADEICELFPVPEGTYDTVSNCHYKVPSYTDIGKVYQRIIFDCTSTPGVQDVIDVFSSFISDDISDFNTATYYCNPSYLYHSYKAGKLLD